MALSHTFKSLNAKLFMFLYFNSFRCKLPTLSPLKAPPHSYYSTNSSPIKIITPGILPTIPTFSFELSLLSPPESTTSLILQHQFQPNKNYTTRHTTHYPHFQLSAFSFQLSAFRFQL